MGHIEETYLQTTSVEPMGTVSYFQELVISLILNIPLNQRCILCGNSQHLHHPDTQDTAHHNLERPIRHTSRMAGLRLHDPAYSLILPRPRPQQGSSSPQKSHQNPRHAVQ